MAPKNEEPAKSNTMEKMVQNVQEVQIEKLSVVQKGANTLEDFKIPSAFLTISPEDPSCLTSTDAPSNNAEDGTTERVLEIPPLLVRFPSADW